MKIKSLSVEDTQNLAKELAIQSDKRIYALVGELGSGKTTFVQAFLRVVGVANERLISPTFLIIKNYELGIRNYGGYQRAYHIDCYRLHKAQELLDLGFRKIIENPNHIVLIEWADKIRELLPRETLWIHFQHGESDGERIIEVL